MHTFIVTLIVLIAVLLILVVVVQSDKGGGLASGFASANQVMGVRKTTDLFEKITWWLMGLLITLCIFSAIFIPRDQGDLEDSIIRDEIIETIPQKVNKNLLSSDEVPN